MGKEIKGAVRIGKERHVGKILLETSEILFRGEGFRLRILFAEISGVTSAKDELRVTTKSGSTVFEVGAVAEKWREKILHPKSRAEKLGVKSGMRIRLAGLFDDDFLKELKTGKAELVDERSAGLAAMTFLGIDPKSGSASIGKHAKKLKGDQALWVVYPKGKKEISENDVIAAGRKAGLKDVKVVGFSVTHTALKFVIPLDQRLSLREK